MALLQRMRNSAQFQAVLQGKPMGRTPHFVLHALQWQAGGAPQSAPQAAQQRPLFADGARYVGVLVPKRWARRAVTRSLVKRQIRAVAAEHADSLPVNSAWVVRLRAEFERKRFPSAASEPLRRAVRAELGQLFGRLRRDAAGNAGVVATQPPMSAQPGNDDQADTTAAATSGTMRGAS